MRAVASLIKFKFRATGNDLLAEGDERLQHLPQIHQLWTAIIQRQHIGTKAGLQLRIPIKLVQHHLGNRVALQLNDNAHTIAVTFVAQIGNALNRFIPHQISDFLNHRGFVHLIRNFRNDDGLPVFANFFNRGTAPHNNRATPRHHGRCGAITTQNKRAGREIRPGHDLQQFFVGHFVLANNGLRRVNQFTQIMRWNIGCHTNCNTVRAVNQQIWKTRRKHHRLAFGIIVIVLKIDCVAVDIFKQCLRRLGHTHFGITHGRRRVAINRTKIALPVKQRQAHGKLLLHSHQRIVNRLVTMRVIFTDNVTNHTG